MSRSLGVLTLDLVAKTGGFEAGMDKAEREAAKRLKGIERQAQQRAKAIEDAFTNMATSIAAPLAAAFSVAGLATFVSNIKTAGVEIQRFSQLAGASAAEFQRFAHGAEKAGVPMDKFADIVKDVQDKLGDFQQTGAGPMADFFEKIAPRVGLTADAFRNLSGPQALQAYYGALEKANLSHAETVFFMEALASDASLLTPLLKDNAAGFAAAAEEADRLGLVMSDNLLAATAELDTNLKQLNAIGQGLAVTIGNAIVPTISAMVGELANAAQGSLGFSGAADGLNAALIGIYNTALGAVTAFRLLGTALGGVGAALAAVASGEFTQAKDIVGMLAADLDRIALSAAASMARVGEAGASIAPLAAAVTTTTPKLTPLANALQGTGRSAKQAGDAIGDLIEKLDAKEIEKAAKLQADYAANVAAMLGPLEEQARAMEEQLENYGRTEKQIHLTTAARIAEARAIAAANGAMPEHLAFLDREIEARERIAAAAGSIAAREANDQAAQDAADAWNDTAKSIEGAIYDAIISGGADGGEVLKRTFKAIVLEPMIRGVASGITGALGLKPDAYGGGGLMGALNTASSVSTLWGALSGGMAASAGSMITGVGSFLGSSTISAFGTGMQGATLTAGLAGPTTAGASGAMGAGAFVGAALPWVVGGLVVADMLGLFDKKPSDKSAWASYEDGRTFDVGSMTGKKDPGQQARDTAAAAALMVGSFADLAGVDGYVRLTTGQRDGNRLALENWTSPTGGLDKFGSVNYGGDFSAALLEMLDDVVDEGTLSTEQVAQWRELKTDFAGVTRDAVEMVSVLNLMNGGLSETEIERANLLQVEGEALESAWARILGIQDAMGGKTADDRWIDYVTNLATAFADVGVEMPRTNSAFLALADSLDITTEEGREAYTAVMSLAPAFVAMTDAINAAFASITATTANSIRDIEMSVLDDAGRYAYLDGEILDLMEGLEAAADPATIAGILEEINTKAMEAWNLLDESEQSRLAGAFISRLEEGEALAIERLESLPAGVQEAATTQKDAGAAMQKAATVMEGAGEAQQQAAGTLFDAAAMLKQALGNIRVTVDARSPEVGY